MHVLVDIYTSAQYWLQSNYPRGYILVYIIISLMAVAIYAFDIVTDVLVAKVRRRAAAEATVAAHSGSAAAAAVAAATGRLALATAHLPHTCIWPAGPSPPPKLRLCAHKGSHMNILQACQRCSFPSLPEAATLWCCPPRAPAPTLPAADAAGEQREGNHPVRLGGGHLHHQPLLCGGGHAGRQVLVPLGRHGAGAHTGVSV